jgi:hypothetical protein
VRRTVVLSMVALALVLTGCSGGSEPGAPEVAALPSTAAGSPTPAVRASASDTSRAQMRLDDTDERRDTLIRAWDTCLVKHGAHYEPANKRAAALPADSTGKAFPQLAEPIPASAKAACQDLLPQMPPELEPDQNPHYRDDWVANVKCLRAQGYQVHLTTDTSAGPGGLTWTYDDNATGELPDDAAQIEQKCMITAFGPKE